MVEFAEVVALTTAWVVTLDCPDPYVYGPFASAEEAARWAADLEAVPCRGDDVITVRPLRDAVLPVLSIR